MKTEVRTVLILASTPWNDAQLRLGEEVREIAAGLRVAKFADRFQLEQRWAVRPNDLQQAMAEVRPHIVHFCGHAAGRVRQYPTAIDGAVKENAGGGSNDPSGERPVRSGGLILEDEQGRSHMAPTAALADLFGFFATNLECVVLNACYTEEQAEAIASHIPYVVGMSDAVADRVAIKFAIGFYGALGAGGSIELAYRMGCNAIALWNLPGHLTPVLKNVRGTKEGSGLIESDTDESIAVDYCALKRVPTRKLEDILRRLKKRRVAEPNGGEIECDIGLICLHLRRFVESQRYFRLAIESGPARGEFYYLYALSVIGGRFVRALSEDEARDVVRSLEAAMQLDANEAKYCYLLGIVKYERGEARGEMVSGASADELFQMAQARFFDPSEGDRMLAAVRVREPRLTKLIRTG